MRASLTASATLLLALAMAGCSGDGDGDGDGDDKSTGPSGASFCDALAEIDAAIDEAETGSDDSWQRIVTAFDTLDEVGIADNLPAPGPDELEHVDNLVRESDSVEEFQAAVEADPPTSDAVGTYISEHCK